MDGNGNIQVNNLGIKSLQYRFIIKLDNTYRNYNMLLNIAKTIGGVVIIVNKKNKILWLVDNKDIIMKIINILSIYPPLTSRLICQLEFIKVSLKTSSVEEYFYNRKNKYKNQTILVEKLSKNKIIPFYFSS
jgi:hypothetical protein